MNNSKKLNPNPNIDEICQCLKIEKILLVHLFEETPIHCYHCKNFIPASRLNLNIDISQRIKNWYPVLSALDNLWLDSGQYESYAAQQLSDKNGQLNKEALAIATELSKQYPTYYWWFSETDLHEFLDPDQQPQITHCPNCNQKLNPNTEHGHGKCETCHIII